MEKLLRKTIRNIRCRCVFSACTLRNVELTFCFKLVLDSCGNKPKGDRESLRVSPSSNLIFKLKYLSNKNCFNFWLIPFILINLDRTNFASY